MKKPPPGADPILWSLKERVFQPQVEHYARLRGWLTYHTWDSRKSVPGFPDLTAVRAGRTIYAELKTMTGQPTPEQCEWLELLAGCPANEVFLWRPCDWDEMECVFA